MRKPNVQINVFAFFLEINLSIVMVCLCIFFFYDVYWGDHYALFPLKYATEAVMSWMETPLQHMRFTHAAWLRTGADIYISFWTSNKAD